MTSRWIGVSALLLALLLAISLAAQTEGVDLLLSKARSLEARGRMDLAAQNWKEVLLVNPKQPDALAGLARYAKQSGQTEEERAYLDRLRKINPKDPRIGEIERMREISPQERERLDEAGRRAMQHKPDEAMKIYKEVFGNGPPSGKWAEAYYQTEAASTGGRDKAIAQLRQLCARDPSNEVYRLWLGRVLVYDPKTRMEGLRSLESIHDPGAMEQARAEWRQALLWEKENPAVLASVNAYVQRYPDPELQGVQKSLQGKHEQAIEEASKERGFQALRGKDMGTAEAQFQDVLRHSPNDVNATTGLAFVRLNQKRFGEALDLFDRARTLAPKRADVREGYETAKFWSLMQQGAGAQQNQPEAAITAYREALALHPGDEQAMLGIARAAASEGKLPDAEAQFQQVLNQSPNNPEANAGLGFIRLRQKRFDDAVSLFDKARSQGAHQPDIEQGYQEAKYWALMQRAATALDQNRADAGISDYQQALAVKPGAADALRGLAGAAERVRNYAEAIQAYNQLTVADPPDAQAWLGLIRTQIQAKHPDQVLNTVTHIPPNIKSQIETRPDYLSEMALAYYSQKRTDDGDRVLRQALAAAAQSDTADAMNARLTVASALVDQGRWQPAIEVYQQATKLHPDNAVAWQGLVASYVRQGNFAQAGMVVRSMPQPVQETVTKNIGFLDSLAAIYSADGECSRAEEVLSRSLSLQRAGGGQPAASTQLQLADIWMREASYSKARQGYREIITRDKNASDAWRGYITALHAERDDQKVLAEAQTMPTAVRTQLAKDANFLALLAGAHSALGQNAQTVQLLQQARGVYQRQGQTPPTELDVQLAWAMLADRQTDPRDFLRKTRSRTDLTEKQRSAIDEIWSLWSVRAAEQALQHKKSEQAIAVLTDAQHDLPNNPKIYAALAWVYMKQHRYQTALSVYQSWGMKEAQAGDYRAAVGAALAAHKNELADTFLSAGLRHFPKDPALLEVKGKQVAMQGKYNDAQWYLKSALQAVQNPTVERQSLGDSEQGVSRRGVPLIAGLTASSPPAPPCRQHTSFLMPDNFRVKLVPASFAYQSSANQEPSKQNQENPAPPPNPQKEKQIQDEIDAVQNRNTPFGYLGSAGSGRAGDAGIDRLIVEDGAFGASLTGANRVRLDLSAHGLYLFSGSPNGGSTQRFGTLAPGASFAQQDASGITGELQLSTETFGLDFSASPSGFLVQNLTGGIRIRPLGGPVTLMLARDSVKDSLLSYAGVRDPVTGIVWGGVVSNSATIQLEHKALASDQYSRSGQYLSASGAYMTGKNVPANWQGSGNAGVYWIVVKRLSVGLNVSGMHYEKNLSFFSLGQGGYFSPQVYGLASIPITWFSRHPRFEYEIRASLGAQYFSQDSSPFFPKQVDATLPLQGFYGSNENTGANYNALVRLGYRVAPHLYFDFFATANNARNYATQTVGFSLKFLGRRLPTNTDLHVKSVPDWKGNRPFAIE